MQVEPSNSAFTIGVIGSSSFPTSPDAERGDVSPPPPRTLYERDLHIRLV